MKTAPLLAALLLGLGIAAFGATQNKSAQPKPNHPETTAVRLRHLIDATLPKISSITGPNTLRNRTDLAERQAEFAARAATSPDNEKPMYQAAAAVCAALIQAEDEHEQAAANLRKSAKTHGPQDRQNLEISNSYRGWDPGAVAQANNAKQNKENADSKKSVLEKEKFLTKGAIASWTTRVAQLRTGIETAYEGELIAEKEAHAALAPAAVAVATVPPPAITPSTASAADVYSPSGKWKNPKPSPKAKSNSDYLLKDDNTAVHGQRHGAWAWLDSAKRTVSVKWADGLVDTLTLSADGQTLDGTNIRGQELTLNRTH